ncbi:MAG: insulinase family protein [Myxococcales bacterium]|nr:insulinase family protein [Myxococcales bacterium]
MIRSLALLGLAVSAAACGGASAATSGPAKVDIPVPDTTLAKKRAARGATRESPPSSGAAKESPFPAVKRVTLPNGLGVAVVTSRTLPVVQVRVLVRAGSGYGEPGVANATAQMLKDGGAGGLSSAELLRRVETLGANLGVSTDFDSTVLSTAVTKDNLGEALSLLSQTVRQPRFDERELKKLKSRLSDEAEDNARSSGAWTAAHVVFKELMPAKSPYATYDALPSEIAKINGASVRAFHRKFYVPKATTVVLAGDVDEATAKQLVAAHFGAWTGGAPPKVEVPDAVPPKGRRVVVCHRPKSVQSDIYLAMLGPARATPGWAHVRVANHVLGGGVASRLFSDVREQRSLAYSTRSSIVELAHGRQPILAYAGTQTAKTVQAVAGLVENVEKIAATGVHTDENATARRYLSDIFAIRMETIGSIADMVVTQDTLSLPDGYWDAYRKEVRETETVQATEAAHKTFDAKNAVLVVAGDADSIAAPLAAYGEVTVVDPEAEFKVLRTVPAKK